MPDEIVVVERQQEIPQEAKKYEKMEVQPLKPSTWGEKILSGLKKTGLALGAVGCGILTLGLLPLVGLGFAIAKLSPDKSLIGGILMLPFVGLACCVDELGRSMTADLKKLKMMAESYVGQGLVYVGKMGAEPIEAKDFRISMMGDNIRNLQLVYNHIVDFSLPQHLSEDKKAECLERKGTILERLKNEIDRLISE